MIPVLAGIAAVVVYLHGVYLYRRRFPEKAFPRSRVVAFVVGISIIAGALLPQIDAQADRSFAAHMAQHVALMMVAPPLVLLGAPLLLLVAAPSATAARRITGAAQTPLADVLFAPITGWLAFIAVLWAAHFTPLYELALQYAPVHVLEHALFLFAAFLFWGSIVQVGYAPRAVPFPARMLFIFLAIPQGAFLGLAIYAARGVLYPHYALIQRSTASALADQQNAGAVMWIGGGFLMFAAFMCTAGAWALHERAREAAS